MRFSYSVLPLAASLSHPVFAAEVFSYTAEYDLYQHWDEVFDNKQVHVMKNLDAPVIVRGGDTVSLTVNIANGRRLGVDGVWFISGSALSSDRVGWRQSEGFLTFGDPNGVWWEKSKNVTSNWCCVGFGQIFESESLSDKTGATTFSSVQWQGTLLGGSDITLPLSRISFLIKGQENSRIFLTGVPEPSTWFLMIFGIGLIGFAQRRQNSEIRGQYI